MSNAISMIATLYSFIFLWCYPSICYSAILIRPQSSLQSEYLPKYKILKEKNLSHTTSCAFQHNNHTTHNIKCVDVKGGRFKLNLTEDGFLHLKKDNSSTFIVPGQFCTTGRYKKFFFTFMIYNLHNM